MDKKTAKYWKSEIKKHFEKIKDETTLTRIFNLIDPLRIKLDSTDFKYVNSVESFARRYYKNNKRKLCIIDLNDILDWKVTKYNVAQTNEIISILEQIKDINDKNFWEKLIAVFRGS